MLPPPLKDGKYSITTSTVLFLYSIEEYKEFLQYELDNINNPNKSSLNFQITQIIFDGSYDVYVKDNLLHRKDGPALVFTGNKYPKIKQHKKYHFPENILYDFWPADDYQELHYINGKLHRENGPAVIEMNGNETWYFNDIVHRENGPAIIRKNKEEWWVNGRKHREDGPAVIEQRIQWWNKGIGALKGEDYDNLVSLDELSQRKNYLHWWINDCCVTNLVEEWIKENNMPYYENWTTEQKIMFKLKFC